MSTFYASLQATAAKLIGDKGRALVLRQQTPGTYDPATASAPVTTVDTPVYGAVLDYPALLIDGTNVQRGDKKVILAAAGLTVEPDTDDQILIAGVPWTIVSPQAVAPDGTVVVWKLQIRR